MRPRKNISQYYEFGSKMEKNADIMQMING